MNWAGDWAKAFFLKICGLVGWLRIFLQDAKMVFEVGFEPTPPKRLVP